MPRSKEFLLEQIARAGPLRAAMNTEADRERFEKMAADLRTELDAAEAAENRASAAASASETRIRLLPMPRRSLAPAARMRPRRHPIRQTNRSRRRTCGLPSADLLT
jgi:hypothetical protein